jgi:hypothetical protein
MSGTSVAERTRKDSSDGSIALHARLSNLKQDSILSAIFPRPSSVAVLQEVEALLQDLR